MLEDMKQGLVASEAVKEVCWNGAVKPSARFVPGAEKSTISGTGKKNERMCKAIGKS